MYIHGSANYIHVIQPIYLHTIIKNSLFQVKRQPYFTNVVGLLVELCIIITDKSILVTSSRAFHVLENL